MTKLTVVTMLSFYLISCTENKKTEPTGTESIAPEKFVDALEYTVVNTLPHDTNSFTEGLVYYNQQLFESTGSPENIPSTRSVFGPVDPKSGKIIIKAELDKQQYFGEGIAFLNDKVYQLTYKNKIGFIYDAKSFQSLGRFSFSSEEGWGLTTDGTSLIMSDGSNILTYLDATTLKPVKTLNVRNAGYAEDYLNELEYINGFIYANVWTKNYIVKIDPSSGDIAAILDLSVLMDKAKKKYAASNVVNGIAYDPVSDKIVVTGKLWPDIYEISFKH